MINPNDLRPWRQVETHDGLHPTGLPKPSNAHSQRKLNTGMTKLQ